MTVSYRMSCYWISAYGVDLQCRCLTQTRLVRCMVFVMWSRSQSRRKKYCGTDDTDHILGTALNFPFAFSPSFLRAIITWTRKTPKINQRLPGSLGVCCTQYSMCPRLQQTSELFFLVGCGRGESVEPQHQGSSMRTRGPRSPPLRICNPPPPKIYQAMTRSGPVPIGGWGDIESVARLQGLSSRSARRMAYTRRTFSVSGEESGHSGHIAGVRWIVMPSTGRPRLGQACSLLSLSRSLACPPVCLPWVYAHPNGALPSLMIRSLHV